jgi:GNAT superfamily N-acetyltransferase
MKETVQIRFAGVSDSSAIHALEHRTYPPHLAETEEALMSRIVTAPEFCAVAHVEDVVLAYVLAHPWPSDSSPGLNAVLAEPPGFCDALHVHDLVVGAEARGLGLGRRLVDWLEAQARGHAYEVLTLVAVDGADRFWAHLGFEDVRAAQGYDAQARFMRRRT